MQARELVEAAGEFQVVIERALLPHVTRRSTTQVGRVLALLRNPVGVHTLCRYDAKTARKNALAASRHKPGRTRAAGGVPTAPRGPPRGETDAPGRRAGRCRSSAPQPPPFGALRTTDRSHGPCMRRGGAIRSRTKGSECGRSRGRDRRSPGRRVVRARRRTAGGARHRAHRRFTSLVSGGPHAVATIGRAPGCGSMS